MTIDPPFANGLLRALGPANNALSFVRASTSSEFLEAQVEVARRVRPVYGLVSPPSWIPSAAAVRAGSDDFEEVTVGILEVHAASAVVVIDLARLLARAASAQWASLRSPNPAEDLVELGFADQKGVVLRRDFVGVHRSRDRPRSR